MTYVWALTACSSLQRNQLTEQVIVLEKRHAHTNVIKIDLHFCILFQIISNLKVLKFIFLHCL